MALFNWGRKAPPQRVSAAPVAAVASTGDDPRAARRAGRLARLQETVAEELAKGTDPELLREHTRRIEALTQGLPEPGLPLDFTPEPPPPPPPDPRGVDIGGQWIKHN